MLLIPCGLLDLVVTAVMAMAAYLAALLLLKEFPSAELGFFRRLLTPDTLKQDNPKSRGSRGLTYRWAPTIVRLTMVSAVSRLSKMKLC